MDFDPGWKLKLGAELELEEILWQQINLDRTVARSKGICEAWQTLNGPKSLVLERNCTFFIGLPVPQRMWRLSTPETTYQMKSPKTGFMEILKDSVRYGRAVSDSFWVAGRVDLGTDLYRWKPGVPGFVFENGAGEAILQLRKAWKDSLLADRIRYRTILEGGASACPDWPLLAALGLVLSYLEAADNHPSG